MDLIAAVNKKDYKLFGAFFRENFPFLVMFADKYVNDMDMAADIAQEAFIQLWRFKGEFVSPDYRRKILYSFSGTRLLKKKLISLSIKQLNSCPSNLVK